MRLLRDLFVCGVKVMYPKNNGVLNKIKKILKEKREREKKKKKIKAVPKM